MENKVKSARETLLAWGWADVVIRLMSDQECEELLESVIMYPEE